ncbi:hypothetical protein BD289DRAFT_453947 [Coniella lustricola]|uniref:Extracellular membrane protein CFEM domain-containing protein n=1 Tax=Coniella lustricola TaxID=2025994 RepID=A0A2T3A5F0_9PEZI|nr:hypothetical protein BD289DRAFT_453947 [Coniella lustricola]
MRRRSTCNTASRALFLLSLCLVSPAAGHVDLDFSAYPDAAQDCLSQSAEASGCNGDDTIFTENDCLCSNTGNFVLATATCLGSDANDDDLSATQVWDLMEENCLHTETPLSVTLAQFQDATLDITETGPSDDANSIAATAAGSSSTASSTPAAQGQSKDGSKLAAGSMTEAIGLSFAILLTATVAVFFMYMLVKMLKLRRAAAASSRAQKDRDFSFHGSDSKLSMDAEGFVAASKSVAEPGTRNEKAAMRSSLVVVIPQQGNPVTTLPIQESVLKPPYGLPAYQEPAERSIDNRVSALTSIEPIPGDGNGPWCPSPLSSAPPGTAMEKNGPSPVRAAVRPLSMLLPQVSVSHVEGPSRSNTGFRQDAPLELAGDEAFDGASFEGYRGQQPNRDKRGTLNTRVQKWVNSINSMRSPI